MSTDNLPAVFQAGAVAKIASAFKGIVAAGIDNSALSEGVGASYGVISIKASKFRIKYKKEEFPITDQNGDPVPSLEAVIIKANPHITKQYYAEGYVDGAASAPDCYSLDGKKPAEEVQNKVHHNCAACPMNQFGSRISENGKKAKACSDTRRIAVVPLNDLRNETFGGPMLFRVPPSALKGLQAYASLLSARGYPYFAVATRIGFDIDASHPLPTFKPIRPLTDDEAEIVAELMNSDECEKVLADFAAEAAADPEAEKPASDELFEQPAPLAKAAAPVAVVAKPAAPAAKPAAPAAPRAAVAPVAAVARPAAPPAKPAAPKAAPKAAPTAAPEPTVASTGSIDDDIANILESLNAIPAEA